MKRFCLGIVANTDKLRVVDILPPFLEWLDSQSIPSIVASDLSSVITLKGRNSLPPEDIADRTDFVLSFGGDGTFLRTARIIAPRETPIIGVNLGRFGYLAEVRETELKERIIDLLEQKYSVQDRLMLEAQIHSESSKKIFYGLNDIVLEKGDFPRSIRLDTFLDGKYLNSFIADGLIVATPTGSTGYSLSVGGPIMEPCIDGLIIDPISPHMLANRPLVVSGDRIVEITAFSEAGILQVSVDGQKVGSMKSGQSISISRASFVTRLVVFHEYPFYELLRNKLHWRTQVEGYDEASRYDE